MQSALAATQADYSLACTAVLVPATPSWRHLRLGCTDRFARRSPMPEMQATAARDYFPFTFAQLSLSVTVRLNTRWPGFESTVSLTK